MFTMKWVTGAAMLVCTGALMACGPAIGATPGAPVGAASAPLAAEAPQAATDAIDPALSGTREVTIVAVQAPVQARGGGWRSTAGSSKPTRSVGASCSSRHRSTGTRT